MLEIGHKAPEFRGEGSTIKGVVEGLKHNKMYIVHGLTESLDLGVANKVEYVEPVPFSQWKIIGLGMMWSENSTANEDPIVEFGRLGDNDRFGKMTSAITGGEKFSLGDHQKYDPFGLLAPEIIAETSATLSVTWTEGDKFNVWRKSSKNLCVTEAAVAGMTSGKVRPYFLVEIDTGGKW